jgi:antitoxin component YwqK of YwqJK toxin-antitoxin module
LQIEIVAQIDVEDGPVKIYYPNGQVSSEGFVKDGKPDGYWKTYYVTGILKSEGKRKNFLLDSTWNFYNHSGDLIEVINYQLGKRSGYTFTYDYNNPKLPGQKTLISKELYINDKKEGESFYYYNTGELKEVVYFSDGKREGYAKEFDRDSTIVTLKQYKDNYLISRERINRKDEEGFKQGTHKTFYADGSVKEEVNYLDDVIHGYFREYDEKGILLQTLRYERGAIIEEIDEEAKEIIDFRRTFDEEGRLIFSGGYIEGVAIGIHRFFDTSGAVINSFIYNERGVKISEGIVDEQGNRKGEWKDFYVTGELRAKGSYSNNRRTGDWIFYFKNGKVEQKGRFLNGRFDGEWIWYYDTGEIWREETYFNGSEDGYAVEYCRSGDIIAAGNYINGEKDGEWIHVVGDHKEVGDYISGLREGEWIYYYENGSKKFEGNYVRGLPDGNQFYYYKNGLIQEEQYYSAGLRERIWRKYDQYGNVKISIVYRDNKEIRIDGVRIRLPESDIKRIR